MTKQIYRHFFLVGILLCCSSTFAEQSDSKIEKVFAQYLKNFALVLDGSGFELVDKDGQNIASEKTLNTTMNWSDTFLVKKEDKNSLPFALQILIEYEESNSVSATFMSWEISDSHKILFDNAIVPHIKINFDLKETYDATRNKFERSMQNYSAEVLKKMSKGTNDFGINWQKLINFFETPLYAQDKTINKLVNVLGGISCIYLGFHIYNKIPKQAVKSKALRVTRYGWNLVAASLVVVGLKGVYTGLSSDLPQLEITDLGKTP